jgi:acyl-CoA hydrolase
MTADQSAAPPAGGAGAPLDLAEFLRPGDRVVWSQACGEPQTLTELLAAQRHCLPEVSCFVGIPAAATFTPARAGRLRFVSYCGTGGNQALHAVGLLDIVPVHYSQLPHLLAGGPLAADVVLVQVSAADRDGRHSLGLTDDYFSAALDTARVVIAEVNDQVPFTCGARTLAAHPGGRRHRRPQDGRSRRRRRRLPRRHRRAVRVRRPQPAARAARHRLYP